MKNNIKINQQLLLLSLESNKTNILEILENLMINHITNPIDIIYTVVKDGINPVLEKNINKKFDVLSLSHQIYIKDNGWEPSVTRIKIPIIINDKKTYIAIIDCSDEHFCRYTSKKLYKKIYSIIKNYTNIVPGKTSQIYEKYKIKDEQIVLKDGTELKTKVKSYGLLSQKGDCAISNSDCTYNIRVRQNAKCDNIYQNCHNNGNLYIQGNTCATNIICYDAYGVIDDDISIKRQHITGNVKIKGNGIIMCGRYWWDLSGKIENSTLELDNAYINKADIKNSRLSGKIVINENVEEEFEKVIILNSNLKGNINVQEDVYIKNSILNGDIEISSNIRIKNAVISTDEKVKIKNKNDFIVVNIDDRFHTFYKTAKNKILVSFLFNVDYADPNFPPNIFPVPKEIETMSFEEFKQTYKNDKIYVLYIELIKNYFNIQ